MIFAIPKVKVYDRRHLKNGNDEWYFSNKRNNIQLLTRLGSLRYHFFQWFLFSSHFSMLLNQSSSLNSIITMNARPLVSHSAQIRDTIWVFLYSFLYPSPTTFYFLPVSTFHAHILSSISLPVSAVEARELSHYLCIGIIGIHVCAWDRAHPEQGPGPRHDKQGVSKAPWDPLICRQSTGILTNARLIFLYIKQP